MLPRDLRPMTSLTDFGQRLALPGVVSSPVTVGLVTTQNTGDTILGPCSYSRSYRKFWTFRYGGRIKWGKFFKIDNQIGKMYLPTKIL